MDLAKLNQYLAVRDTMGGWITPGAAELFAWVDRLQKEEGIVGNLFEIGVHHGKTSVLLGNFADSTKERMGVCDVFGLAEKNITESGHGDREIFLNNFKSYVGDCSFLQVFEKRSAELVLDEIGTGYRFFHIDGGHSAGEVFGDLCLAESALSERGIIAVDDYFNGAWPGVSEGVCRFMFERPARLAPVAVGFNKVLFSRPSQQKWYVQQLSAPGWEHYFDGLDPSTKLREFFGVEIAVYIASPKVPILDRIGYRFKSLVGRLRNL
ncbi:MAG: class I SAM-dependent methyltransferase [Candidatus Omnitrophica bacterium]|nr:class I SAM-dependent methyltransferase [Candidatus Omnitrophota bacterium]